jgi:type II secretory pathway pseudopilin PulG
MTVNHQQPRYHSGNTTAEQGFSFIEILVFVTIISFLFIALTATVTSSLRRMQVAEHRLYALHYAEELLEWIRAEKETDWATFVGRDSSGSGTIYCFNSPLNFLTPAWPADNVACANYTGVAGGPQTVPKIFKRYAVITQENVPTTQINVQIVVEWQDGNQFYSVPLNSVLTQYTDD